MIDWRPSSAFPFSAHDALTVCAQAVPVRCLSPLDTLRAGIEAGAPPSILPGGAGIDLYFSDLEGSDFDVLYAALAAGIRPVLLVVEHSHRKGWDGDVALLRDAHGYVRSQGTTRPTRSSSTRGAPSDSLTAPKPLRVSLAASSRGGSSEITGTPRGTSTRRTCRDVVPLLSRELVPRGPSAARNSSVAR